MVSLQRLSGSMFDRLVGFVGEAGKYLWEVADGNLKHPMLGWIAIDQSRKAGRFHMISPGIEHPHHPARRVVIQNCENMAMWDAFGQSLRSEEHTSELQSPCNL